MALCVIVGSSMAAIRTLPGSRQQGNWLIVVVPEQLGLIKCKHKAVNDGVSWWGIGRLC